VLLAGCAAVCEKGRQQAIASNLVRYRLDLVLAALDADAGRYRTRRKFVDVPGQEAGQDRLRVLGVEVPAVEQVFTFRRSSEIADDPFVQRGGEHVYRHAAGRGIGSEYDPGIVLARGVCRGES